MGYEDRLKMNNTVGGDANNSRENTELQTQYSKSYNLNTLRVAGAKIEDDSNGLSLVGRPAPVWRFHDLVREDLG